LRATRVQWLSLLQTVKLLLLGIFLEVAASAPMETTMSAVDRRLKSTLLVGVPLSALLILSVWFAATAWNHIGGDPIPSYGYVAIAGGVLFSLLIGGGLMALVFYSSRHGYDDETNHVDQ